MGLNWTQHAGLYPWKARTEKGAYEVASYLGSHGPRYVAWFKTGKDIQDVSGMHRDIEHVKAQAEKHAMSHD
jgi:hypothetical protein